MAEAIAPLDVMLRAMREFLELKNWKAAADIAKAAAPYVHVRAKPRVEGNDVATVKDDELAALCEFGRAGTAITSGDTREPGGMDPICLAAARAGAGAASDNDNAGNR